MMKYTVFVRIPGKDFINRFVEKASIEKTKEEVYSLAEICNQILSDEKNLNAKFLEFLGRESKRTGKPFQKIVEDLYKRFQEERRNSVSDWQMEMHNMRNDISSIRERDTHATGYPFFNEIFIIEKTRKV